MVKFIDLATLALLVSSSSQHQQKDVDFYGDTQEQKDADEEEQRAQKEKKDAEEAEGRAKL